MIALVYGTTAELIKLAPIHHRLAATGAPPLHWCTAQQYDELPEAARLMGMPEPDVWLARGAGGHSLRSTADAARWLMTVTGSVASNRRTMKRRLCSDHRTPMILVHGDTMTTVLGSLLGRVLRVRVGHVEAGLRSHDWRNPFPEEIDRRIVGRLASVHYAPGAPEVENLRRSKGDVVVTGGNTVWDSIALVPDEVDPGVPDLPETFGLVSLHRLELLQDGRFAQSLEALRTSASSTPLVMVYDPVTDEQIDKQGLGGLFDDHRLRRIPKLPYFRFVALLRRSTFVVTDSGGLQEECAYLGKPCLVHRVTTERSDGLGANARVSGMSIEELERFLGETHHALERDSHRGSPSDVIVGDLARRGMVGPRPTT